MQSIEESNGTEAPDSDNMPEVSKAIMQQAENYLSERYDFRRNVVIEKTEFKRKDEPHYTAMKDRDYNTLYRQLQKAEIKASISLLFSLLNSDYVQAYDPFIEYFNSLPEWDGVDYIQELAETVKTTDDPFWNDCFKRWLVSMVGCAIQDDIVNHTVIVLTGKQGLGKTTWLMNLLPPQLRSYRYSGNIRPGSRDSQITMSETMLINLDELESLNRGELGALKETITKGHIRARRAYGRTAENYVRRASFCGSVNKMQFLTDTTGSRRFLCFETESIDYMHRVNYELVYAQAITLFKKGYQYWFNEEEIAAIAENNEKYQVTTAEEDLLLKYFTPSETGIFYTTTAIAEIISSRGKMGFSNSTVQAIGKALNKHGFARIKKQGNWGYLAKEIKH